MPKRRRDLFILFGLGILVNGVVALLVKTPGYVDAYYYFNGGVFIAEGQGLFEPYLWNYAGIATALPTPAFAYWQPLASLLVAAGIWLFGQQHAFGAAQAVYVLLAAVLPIMTYTLADKVGERRQALLAGLIMVFSGFYVIYWSLPETFTPFALTAAGTLILIGAGREKDAGRWMWLAAGACAALAHLTRADGLLLPVIVVLFALLPDGETSVNQRIWQAGLGLLGYIAVMLPWYARNIAAFGSIQAPGGLDTLWLVDYNDLFSYPANLSLQRYFAAGWNVILRSKWQALLGNLATFVGVQNLVFLTPFTLIGVWRHWRASWLLPALVYGVVLFAAMTFGFSLPGVRGGWLHSAGALMPFIIVVGVLGLDVAILWLAQRLEDWRAVQAQRVFGVAAVLLAIIVSGYIVLTRVVGLDDLSTVGWNYADLVYAEIGVTLAVEGISVDAAVMSNNPPGFYAHTERGGIPLPNGDESTLLAAADAFGVSYLVVDKNVPAGLFELYYEGAQSERFALIEQYGTEDNPVYLYEILPENE